MKSFEDTYAMLNQKQRQAVDTIDGPVFVLAGPGTGKTQILTLRIANILKQGNGVTPENILALTFTNAGAYNMRRRLAEIIGPEEAYRVYTATFHGFAEDMVKRYREYFPRFDGARLISSIEQIELVEDLANRFGGELFSVFKRQSGTLRSIVAAISKIKSKAIHPNELRRLAEVRYEQDLGSDEIRYARAYGEFKKGDLKPREVARITKKRDKNLSLADIYEAYEEALRMHKLYDYDDLIISVVDEFKSDSDFQAELQEQFQYILVDEHQDTNDGQNAILHALIDNPVWEGKPNVFVVGDAKQSIFRFAGASQESFTELFGRLREVISIELEDNYRSHQGVLDHATNLIRKSLYHRQEPGLKAFHTHDGELSYREFSNYKYEALWVAEDIRNRILEGTPPDEIAVLARNNRDLRNIRTLLGVYKIGYQDHTKKNLLDDPDALKLFLLLRTVYNSADDEALGKALFIDFLGFNPITVQRILRTFKGLHGKATLLEVLVSKEYLEKAGVSEDEQDAYLTFVGVLSDLKRQSENLDFVSFFSVFVRAIGYLDAVMVSPDSAHRLAILETLFDEIRKESGARDSFTITDFLSYLDVVNQHGVTIAMNTAGSHGVSLMTFHGSKGLEFNTVYLVRAQLKKAPPKDIDLPFDDWSDGDPEDERRLMYVAVTRAKENCFISSSVVNEDGREQNRAISVDEMDTLPQIDMETWEDEHRSDLVDFFRDEQSIPVSLANPEFIKEKFFDGKLSVSALNNYVESPVLYFFRNLVLLPEAKNPALLFGSLIHRALELFFEASIEEGMVLGKQELEESFNKACDEQYEYDAYRERGWNILSAYFDNYAGSFELPVKNELRVPAIAYETRSGHQINLTGVVDKVTISEDGEVTVWDYKTGKTYQHKDKEGKANIKRQATFYKLLFSTAFGGRYHFKHAVFDFLEPNPDTGEYERALFTITQEDVEALRIEIDELVDRVVAGTLLEGDVKLSEYHRDLARFLELLKGPRSYEQPPLL